MSSLLGAILHDSLLEIVDAEDDSAATSKAGEEQESKELLQEANGGGDCDDDDNVAEAEDSGPSYPPHMLTPSVAAALRLIKTNPHVICEAGDDGVPNIFHGLHSLPVVDAILERFPDEARVVKEARLEERPLHAACATPNVQIEIIRALLRVFPEAVSIKTREGKTALHIASANPTASPQILSLLANQNPEAAQVRELRHDSLPLHYACAFRACLDSVEVLLKHNPQAVQAADGKGNLPLHLACLYQSPPEVIELLSDQYPPALSVPDGKGRLPLHLATISAQPVSVVERLLALNPGAVDQAVPDGGKPPKKPIHFAIRQKSNLDVVQVLLRASRAADTDMSVSGDTLLHSALEFSASEEVVRTIIATHPASVRELNVDGKLPLHFAAWHQSPPAIISLLLEAFPEAVKEKEAKGGNLPLHYAIQYAPQGPTADVRPALMLLEAFPAAVFETNNKGFFPIHLAARSRCPLALLDALLKFCPFSVGFPDKDPKSGLVPLDYALRLNASADVIARLLGVPKGEPVAAKITSNGNGNSNGNSNGRGKEEGWYEDLPDVDEKELGLKDALLELQARYAAQGEDYRGLRRRMDKQTKELQANIKELKALKHELSWRDDKIRILQRELDIHKKELETLK